MYCIGLYNSWFIEEVNQTQLLRCVHVDCGQGQHGRIRTALARTVPNAVCGVVQSHQDIGVGAPHAIGHLGACAKKNRDLPFLKIIKFPIIFFTNQFYAPQRSSRSPNCWCKRARGSRRQTRQSDCPCGQHDWTPRDPRHWCA